MAGGHMLRGINYDTGFAGATGEGSRTGFDPGTVRRELAIIATDLHCDAVRISGNDPDRITTAAHAALDAGLQVWFAPFPMELTPAELDPYFARCARAAETIRARDPETVLVLGCEMSLFCRGFVPGDTLPDRLRNATDPQAWARFRPETDFTTMLTGLAATARAHFAGRLTYASGEWEDIDWTPFDVAAVDLYRDANNAADFPAHVRKYHDHGKPVHITEFGCCTYQGAAAAGGLGWSVIDHSVTPHVVTGDHVRDETEQVRYFTELLDVFQAENVAGAFWFTFAAFDNPTDPDPHHDLDLAGYGTVKVLPGGAHGTRYPDLTWEPKQVFDTIAARYAALPGPA